MESFTASRLVLARQRRGLTQAELAGRVGLSERSIVAYENKQTTPNDEHTDRLAKALRFPRSFFSALEIEVPKPDIASFRSMKRMAAHQRDMALAAGAISVDICNWIEQRFALCHPNVPNHRGFNPEEAAIAVRHAWGVGNNPIKNMVHLLEANGVRVFSLIQDSVEVDAFSLWRGTVPYVFLNTLKSGEHGRFDAAHELGHLVLHRHGEPSGRDAEREADAFASSFLMPRESVIAHASRTSALSDLVAMKRIWGVSVAALAYRMHTLKLLTDWRYRSVCCEIGSRGYHKNEPDPIRRETSQALAKVFTMLREDGIGKPDLARDLHLHVADLEALVFGLALLPTQMAVEAIAPAQPPPPPQLRLAFARNPKDDE